MMKDDEGWLISSWFGVLLSDEQTDKQTDICDCRVAFATENIKAKLENLNNLMEKQGGDIGKFK